MPKKITNIKKEKRIQQLKNVLKSFGFVVDKWQNYNKKFKGKQVRFKIYNIKIQFEIDCDPWLCVFDERIIKITPAELTQYLIEKGFRHEYNRY